MSLLWSPLNKRPIPGGQTALLVITHANNTDTNHCYMRGLHCRKNYLNCVVKIARESIYQSKRLLLFVLEPVRSLNYLKSTLQKLLLPTEKAFQQHHNLQEFSHFRYQDYEWPLGDESWYQCKPYTRQGHS